MADSSAASGVEALAEQSVNLVQHKSLLTEDGKKAVQAEVDIERAGEDDPKPTGKPSKPPNDPKVPPLFRLLRTIHWHICYNPLVYVPSPLLASLALLLPLILIAQKDSPNDAECAARATECGFEGNEDAYGFGIRLGIYLQWLASVLICTAVPSEERSSMASMAIFSFSILLAVMFLTFSSSKSCVFEIEIIVMLFIVVTTELILRLSHTVRDIRETNEEAVIQATGVDRGRDDLTPYFEDTAKDGIKPLRRVGTFMSSLGSEQGRFGWTLATGVIDLYCLTYLTWFWIRKAMPHAASPFAPTPCGTSIFLIGRIQGESSTRATSVFLAACSTAQLAYNFLNEVITWVLSKKQAARVRTVFTMVFVGLFAFIGVIVAYLILKIRELLSSNGWMDVLSEEETDEMVENVVLIGFLGNIVAVPIIGIELSLVWNKVSGVYSISSTGQLIPFVIGLAGFLPICWKLCRHRLYHYHQKQRERSSEIEVDERAEAEARTERAAEAET